MYYFPGVFSVIYTPFLPFQSGFLSGKVSRFSAVRMNNLLRSFPLLNFRLKYTIEESCHDYNIKLVINELYYITISAVWRHADLLKT